MSSTSDILSTYGPDVHEDGTVLVFFKRYVLDGPTYTYVAVRGNRVWYCTDGKQYKWTKLIEEINRENLGDKSLYELSEVEPVWQDPDTWKE